DPGELLTKAFQEELPQVRSEALRLAGTLGRHQFVSTIANTVCDEPECFVWAAHSAVLLGDRGGALGGLAQAAVRAGPRRSRAFRLALQALTLNAARGVLQSLGRGSKDLRWVIQGGGIAGDPTYIPWLIGHMADDQYARLAGEAFSSITGADLALLDL